MYENTGIKRKRNRNCDNVPTRSFEHLSFSLFLSLSLLSSYSYKNRIPTTETASSLFNTPLLSFFPLLVTPLPLHLLTRRDASALSALHSRYLISEGAFASVRATFHSAASRETRNKVASNPYTPYVRRGGKYVGFPAGGNYARWTKRGEITRGDAKVGEIVPLSGINSN